MGNRPLFSRLLAVSLSVLFCAAVFVFLQSNSRAKTELLQEFKAREANTLKIVEWLVAGKAPYADLKSFREVIGELGRRFNIRVTYVAMHVGDGFSPGKVLADSGVEPSRLDELPDHSDRPEIVQARREGFGTATRFSDTLTTEMLYMAMPMRTLAGIPDGMLRIAVPYSTVQQVLSESRNQLLAIIAAMAVCAAGLTLFLIRRTQNALRTFSQAVDDLGHEEMPGKIRVYPGLEFKPLADSINSLSKMVRKNSRSLYDTRLQFEAVLANMTDAVAILDQDGNILAHNPALDRLLPGGGDATGQHVLAAGLGLTIHEAVTQCLRPESCTPLRFLAQLANGGHADVDLVPYSTQKGKRRLILVLHDVTAMKNAERILRSFVVNASHQLRTPLTSIQGYAATLLDSPPAQEEQCRAMLSTILKRSEEMRGVVTDLLQTATPQAERQTGTQPANQAPDA